MIRDERGQSVSVFVTVVFAAMIMTAGLVIDGGQKITAASRAETAAAGAAEPLPMPGSPRPSPGGAQRMLRCEPPARSWRVSPMCRVTRR